MHPNFDAKISIRQDHANDFETFKVGTYGLCISCADEISSKLLCEDCNDDKSEFCHECEHFCLETFDVINRHGEYIHVCANCLDEYYRFCEHCEEYHPKDEFSVIGDGSLVCHTCLERDYALCSECDEYFLADELSPHVNADGKIIYLCESCRDAGEVPA